MTAGTQSRADSESETAPPDVPEVSVCEVTPRKRIFIEEGNTDGWISSDLTVENVR
jgi:hypothetical protein